MTTPEGKLSKAVEGEPIEKASFSGETDVLQEKVNKLQEQLNQLIEQNEADDTEKNYIFAVRQNRLDTAKQHYRWREGVLLFSAVIPIAVLCTVLYGVFSLPPEHANAKWIGGDNWPTALLISGSFVLFISIYGIMLKGLFGYAVGKNSQKSEDASDIAENARVAANVAGASNL